jgi:GTP cyclohydrolase I
VPLVDEEKLIKAVASIIDAIGEDPEREGLKDTPKRVARMYKEMFSGLDKDPADELATGFDEGYNGFVIVKDVPFFSICEHHFLPFYGNAHIGYIPNGRVVGVSKLARALDILARRPQLQERLTDQLADSIFTTLQPQGVSVVISAEHMCLSLRGATKPGSKMVTSADRGNLRTLADKKHQFLSMIGET